MECLKKPRRFTPSFPKALSLSTNQTNDQKDLNS